MDLAKREVGVPTKGGHNSEGGGAAVLHREPLASLN